MLKRLISRFKTKFSSEEVDENRLQKKVQVDYWLSGLQHNWNELESVLFWKDARISSATFVVITVFFWYVLLIHSQPLEQGSPNRADLSVRKWLDPLQDHVKSRRDPVFIKQKVIVFIPTLELTHIVGKRIFK